MYSTARITQSTVAYVLQHLHNLVLYLRQKGSTLLNGFVFYSSLASKRPLKRRDMLLKLPFFGFLF